MMKNPELKDLNCNHCTLEKDDPINVPAEVSIIAIATVLTIAGFLIHKYFSQTHLSFY